MMQFMKLRLEHVTERKNKDGSIRYYFQRRGQPVVRLPGDPRSPEFMEAYQRCLSPLVADNGEGTFAWLCQEYMSSSAFRMKSKATQISRKRIILSLMAEPIDPNLPYAFGAERLQLTRKHIQVLRDRKADHPNAANERLKVLSQIFKLAVARDYVTVNPMIGVERLSVPRGGHRTATDEDLERYHAFHTERAPRLAMAILQATGVRVSDLRVLGRQHIRNGRIVFDTKKTGVRCELPISTDLDAAIRGCNTMTFVNTEAGMPFASDKALSNRISKWFKQAGVERVTAHSVRKWLATKMAEAGASEYELMAWFGWRDPKEARPYVQSANRRKLAGDAGRRMTQ